MAGVSTFNHVPEGRIGSLGHVNVSRIGSIGHVAFSAGSVADSVDISSPALYYDIFGDAIGDNFVVVTSSGSWTASNISDSYSIISSYTTSGVSNEALTVYVNSNPGYHSDCATATIRITVNTVYVDLLIYQDGTVITCT